MPASAALDPTAELHACLDRLDAPEAEWLRDGDQAELLRSLTRVEARVVALRLRVLAAADHTQAGATTGAASTGQWAAALANTDPAAAERQVGLARSLEEHAATRRALAHGAITAEHAAVIMHADRHLPAGLDIDRRSAVEERLIEQAQRLAPTALRRAARRALAEVESDQRLVDAHEDALLAYEEAQARRRTCLTLHDNGDGTLSGHFTVPALHGQLLRKLLETITAPRRGRLGAPPAQVGDLEVRTDWARARGAAFCELIEHLPTDHLHPRTAATLVVALDEETLRGMLRAADLDTGERLSSGEVRRLLCGAGVIPGVLGGGSLPLDLGRSSRLFTEAQRTALGVRFHRCAADGCERPFAWCELHHRRPWSQGGRTDLGDAIPLCHFHHRRIHDPRYRHSEEPDGTIAFHLAEAGPGGRRWKSELEPPVGIEPTT